MTTTHIDTALTYLTDAYVTAEYGDRLAYVAPETSEAILVGPEQLADLGRRLEAEQPDAYSLWCAEAGCLERVTGYEAASTIRCTVDLDRLRDEAANSGDMATVIALDLLRADVEAALEAGVR